MIYNDDLGPVQNFTSIFNDISKRLNFAGGVEQFVINGLLVNMVHISCEFGQSTGLTVIDQSTNERVSYFEKIDTTEDHIDELQDEDNYLDTVRSNFDDSLLVTCINGMGFDIESACRSLFVNLGGVG